MILMRILPGVLKELSKHVPTILFQAVDWGELAHEIPLISRRIIQKEGYDNLLSHLSAKLSSFNILLTRDSLGHNSLKGNYRAGEQILCLYFAQIYSTDGLFLDLRSNHFGVRDDSLLWHPGSFSTKLEEHFRLGLLKVYEGFYLEKEDLYFEGLKAIGLIHPDWSEEDKSALGALFRKHFGQALNEKQSFNLDHLKVSIIQMSEFMLNKKVKIPKDFLYIGIYLVGLYSTLEETESEFSVKDIFLRVKERLAQ